MTRYHATAAGQIPFTPDEEAEWEARFVPTPEEQRKAQVPQTLPMRQAKLVLLAAGLLDDVDAAVAGADRATQIEWEYAQEVSRTWPSLVAMATALGMTDAQLDDLFIQGAKL